MQLMRRAIVGGLCVLTAVISGYLALRIFQQVNGEPRAWWTVIMLGASILLLGGGIHVVVTRVPGGWFALFAAAFPLVLCRVLFGVLPLGCWLFAFAVALSMGIIQALAGAFKGPEYVVLITSLILAASWVPVSVNTLRVYFSLTAGSPNRFVLLFLLGMWVLIFESVVAAILLCKSLGSDER
jgi:hypothetical protein